MVIIPTLPNSLTGSRGEYLRVVGIHSDGRIDKEISIVTTISNDSLQQ